MRGYSPPRRSHQRNETTDKQTLASPRQMPASGGRKKLAIARATARRQRSIGAGTNAILLARRQVDQLRQQWPFAGWQAGEVLALHLRRAGKPILRRHVAVHRDRRAQVRSILEQ